MAPSLLPRWLRWSLAGLASGSLLIPTSLWLLATFYNLGVSEQSVAFLPPPFNARVTEFDIAFKGRGIALFTGPVCGILISILALVVLLRTSRVYRRGYFASVAVLLTGLSISLYLMIDASPAVPPDGHLWHLKTTVQRVPKALYLQCSKDEGFGRVQAWPKVEISSSDNESSKTSITGNREQILRDWETIAPIRKWVAEMNGYEGFDDYVVTCGSPLVDFPTLRQYVQTVRRHALLLTYEGRSEEAVIEARNLLLFGQKLEDGSRCVVTFMIGIVVEKAGLRLLLSMIRDGGAKLTRSELVGFDLDRDREDWSDYARALRCDGQSVIKSFALVDTAIALSLRIIFRFVWNPNSTIAGYQMRVETLATAVSNREFSVVANARDQPKDGELPRALHFKNMVGELTADFAMPIQLPKIGASLFDAKRLRGELLAVLR